MKPVPSNGGAKRATAAAIALCAALFAPAGRTLAGQPKPPAGPKPAAAQGAPLPDLTIGVSRLKSSLAITNKSFTANSCSVVEGCIGSAGTHRLLIFDLQIINQGAADAVLGSPSSNPSLYVWSPCHGHYHILDSLDYSIAYGGTDTGAIYDSATGTFFLRNSNTPGAADVAFSFGAGGAAVPLSGDWDGDGRAGVGLYIPATGTFFLKNSAGPGAADLAFNFGAAGAAFQPIAGDWNGDGTDTIGLYDPATSTFFLKNTNAPGPADVAVSFGAPAGLVAVTGDWNGDGAATIGVYNPATGTFFLKDTNAPGGADYTFTYGAGGAVRPLSGDWNADGKDTVGLYDPATGAYFLRDANAGGPADQVYTFGVGGAGVVPLAGDWDFDQNGPTVPGITGLKQAFCWLDSLRVSGTLPGKYTCSNQGITAGWSDVYTRNLDCQWIDITGLAAGNYQLRASVNDTHTIVAESDYTNNNAAVKIHVTPASASPLAPTVNITAPGAGRFKVGDAVKIKWEIQNPENITHQEVWLVPSPKKKNEDDHHDAIAEPKLLVADLPPTARSFTWVPTDLEVLDTGAKILVRTSDTRTLVGTDTFSKDRVRIVPRR